MSADMSNKSNVLYFTRIPYIFIAIEPLIHIAFKKFQSVQIFDDSKLQLLLLKSNCQHGLYIIFFQNFP